MPHTPEPWYLRTFTENFPYVITTNPEPEENRHVIALILRECRRPPVACTTEQVKGNGELIVRAPRMAHALNVVHQFFARLEDLEPDDPLKTLRAISHRPIHAAMDPLIAELKKAGLI